jgi:hypothetical protein
MQLGKLSARYARRTVDRESHSVFFRDEGGRGPFWVRRHDEYEM